MSRRFFACAMAVLLAFGLVPFAYAEDKGDMPDRSEVIESLRIEEYKVWRDDFLNVAVEGVDYKAGTVTITCLDCPIDEIEELAGQSGFTVETILDNGYKGNKDEADGAILSYPTEWNIREAVDAAESHDIVLAADPNWIYKPAIWTGEYIDWSKKGNYSETEFWITFIEGVTEKQVYDYLDNSGFKIYDGDQFHEKSNGIYVCVIDGMTLEESMAFAESSDLVASTDHLYYAAPANLTEGETPEGESSYITNPIEGGYAQWYPQRISLQSAWDLSQSAGETSVAVLDTGIMLNHEDLKNNIDFDRAYDAVAQTALTGDIERHGTMVAGVISAQANNGIGVTGVSFNARIIPIRIAYWNDEGEIRSDNDAVVRAMQYLLDEDIDNLRVVNFSYTGYGETPASIGAKIAALRNNDVLFVAAAGNDTTDAAAWPSDRDDVISVIATDSDSANSRADFSNYGSAKNICAPGTGICTTNSNGGYASVKGTSFSAPIVSGVLALMFAADPTLSADDAQSILESTATDLGAEGFDSDYGWGLVNARAALEEVVDLGTRTSIVGATVTFDSTPGMHVRNGAATPIVTVRKNGQTLTNGTHYRVVYNYNTGVSVGDRVEVTIIGIGNYCGTISKGFYVQPWWQRIAGEDAADTMLAVSGNWADNSCSSVILVSQEAWKDSVIASGLAGILHCPILYSGQTSVSQDTLDEISRLGASTVYIIGGEYWIKPAVVTQLNGTAGIGSVVRLAGDTAWETSVAVYNQGQSLGSGWTPGWGSTALVVGSGGMTTNEGYQDAVTVAPFAYAKRGPVFMVDWHGEFDSATLSAISSGGFSNVVVASGTYWISDTQFNLLPASSRVRVCGDYATQTAVAFANWSANHGMNRHYLGVATYTDFRDALVAGPLQGKKGSPILLVASTDYSDAQSYVSTWKTQLYQGYVYGGPAIISNACVAALETAAS